jgi:hypothetical protein
VDEYLEISRTSKREENLKNEVERLRSSFSFQFGNIFVQSFERPVTLPLLPFKIIGFMAKKAFGKKNHVTPPTKITRDCVVGYSADSFRGVHFNRMERILSEFRTHGIETVHITNDREIRSFKKVESHSLYSIPPRSEFARMIPRTWNKKVEQIVSSILDTFHPRTILFDGDYPFRGILNAISLRPEMNRFWIRESLLNFKTSTLPVDGFDTFDAIIHPSMTRRDDPDTIIGSSGTIFCNPIVGKSEQTGSLSRLRLGMVQSENKIVFVQLSKKIKNLDQVFQEILSYEGCKILCVSTQIPKSYRHHERVVNSNALSIDEAICMADLCLISPDFYNLYSCFNQEKPTLCIAESQPHIDSINREFGTNKLPIILVNDVTDSSYLSDGIERLFNSDLQEQLRYRMKEYQLLDGTPDLCNHLRKLHESNQVIKIPAD